jgi:hypothetical protein
MGNLTLQSRIYQSNPPTIVFRNTARRCHFRQSIYSPGHQHSLLPSLFNNDPPSTPNVSKHIRPLSSICVAADERMCRYQGNRYINYIRLRFVDLFAMPRIVLTCSWIQELLLLIWGGFWEFRNLYGRGELTSREGKVVLGRKLGD